MDELDRAQSSLGRALGRARAGEDRELAQKVREGGEQLVQLLAGLLKLTRVHSPGQPGLRHAGGRADAAAGRALGEALGTVSLVTVEDQVYLNDIRVRTDNRPGAAGLGTRAAAPQHRRAHVPRAAHRARRSATLVKGLAGPPAPEWPRGTLGQWLLEQGLGALELHGIYRFQAVRSRAGAAGPVPGAGPQAAGRPDRRGAGTTSPPGGCSIRCPIRRAVVEALESGIEAPAFWLGFPDCPPHAAHAVEVAMVALLLGKAAGFPSGLPAGPRHRGAGSRRRLPGAVGRGGGCRPGAPPHRRGAPRAAAARLLGGQAAAGCAACWSTTATQADPPGPPSAIGAVLRLAEDYANVIRLYGIQGHARRRARRDAQGRRPALPRRCWRRRWSTRWGATRRARWSSCRMAASDGWRRLLGAGTSGIGRW